MTFLWYFASPETEDKLLRAKMASRARCSAPSCLLVSLTTAGIDLRLSFSDDEDEDVFRDLCANVTSLTPYSPMVDEGGSATEFEEAVSS